jgi:hypothetical protein
MIEKFPIFLVNTLLLFRSQKHSSTPYPSLSPYRQTDRITDRETNTLAACGLEELFFQLCHCVSFFVVAGNSFRCYLPTIPVVPLCLVAQVSFLFVGGEILGVTYVPTIPVVPLCQFFGFSGKKFLVAQFLRKILIRFP